MLEIKKILQDAQTAAGNGTAVDMGGAGREHSFYLEAAGTVSAGAVTIETARTTTFSGTWDPIAGPVTLVSNSVIRVAYTGVLLAVRARISTAVTGGATCTVEVVAN